MDRQIIRIEKYLPPALCAELSAYDKIDEIRLRAGRRCSISSDGGSTALSFYADRACVEAVFCRLCRNSVYSQTENIIRGFILLPEGIRVGVCGCAVCAGEKLINVAQISSLCIRIPHDVFGVSGRLYEFIKARGFSDSVLICSPPGVGKTTLLRDLARALSCGKDALRVCVADERGELYFEDRNSMADIYLSYPKARAVSAAVRTMSPQYVVCDEIGAEDIPAMSELRCCGVPVIASAHAGSTAELRTKPGIASLIDGGMFDVLVCISRERGSGNFDFEIEELRRNV